MHTSGNHQMSDFKAKMHQSDIYGKELPMPLQYIMTLFFT